MIGLLWTARMICRVSLVTWALICAVWRPDETGIMLGARAGAHGEGDCGGEGSAPEQHCCFAWARGPADRPACAPNSLQTASRSPPKGGKWCISYRAPWQRSRQQLIGPFGLREDLTSNCGAYQIFRVIYLFHVINAQYHDHSYPLLLQFSPPIIDTQTKARQQRKNQLTLLFTNKPYKGCLPAYFFFAVAGRLA